MMNAKHLGKLSFPESQCTIQTTQLAIYVYLALWIYQ